MPIIEKRTVMMETNEIPGIDYITYIDACFVSGNMWADASWEVWEVYPDTLTDEQQSLAWQIAEAHQLTQHEGDDE